ncbi:MAG TPA: gamma carbonic anhydrase family protein [Elusimicrobiota bacterium]|nr:gamma carbonic anhydrase family protein [Elusimicrobiota bacterium]
MIRELEGVRPDIDTTAFVHDTAEVVGKVRIGPRSSLWPYAVLRGDVDEIVVGEGTNIQDHTVIHTSDTLPAVLGNWVTVGHSVVLHGCRIGDHCLIGMGAILLDGVVVEKEAMVGAGALVPPGMKVPSGHLAVGVPAKVIRPLRPEEIRQMRDNAEQYLVYVDKHVKTSKIISQA